MRYHHYLSALLMFAASISAHGQYHDPIALQANPNTATSPLAPRLDGIGNHSFRVTTSVDESQAFFDQGLMLTYAFNHSEALRSFKEAARLDPANAMAWWGQALVLGSNINLPMMEYVAADARAAMQKAQELKAGVTPLERGLIEALAVRFVLEGEGLEDSTAYMAAMLTLYDTFPGDPDVATLAASAIMNTTPWDYWSRDGKPYDSTILVMEILQAGMLENPRHTGLLHYYIHIVEAQRPGLGERAADTLRGSTPNAGHLLHMPSHIYMRLGRYADSYDVNSEASEADASYIAACQAQGIYPVGYYPHNVHFMVWSAQSMGRYKDAMQAARQIREKIPGFIKELSETPTGSGADGWLMYETFMSQPLFTMVRFGDWEAILNEQQPVENAIYMTGIWHYARGLAYVHTDKDREARKELKQLNMILQERGIADYPASINGAERLLQIAAATLQGELLAANEDYDKAVAHLARAVWLQDGLNYMEPPDWFMPVRHYLGAVLLEAGRSAEAAVIYADDLRNNPDNGYALIGLAKAQAAGGDKSAAEVTRQRYEQAWSQADKPLTSSRY
ncbi:MAG: hypothetical protein ACR2QG_06565 [Gammaproteobacteria bacterium]